MSGTVSQAQTRFGSSTLRQVNAQSSPVQGVRTEHVLEPGKPVERELAGGASHSYRVALTSGQYLHLSVEQRGVDVALTLRGPDGATLSEMDGQRGLAGVEEMSWEATGTGLYVLEVRAREQAAHNARYEVRVWKAEAATQRDSARVAAERLFMEAIRAEAETRGAGPERAAGKYREAVEQWRAAGDRKWEAQTLHNIGSLYRNASQFEKAADSYGQALAVRREIKDRDGEGATLNGLATLYLRLSQREKARGFYEQALAIRREVGDREGEGQVLNNLGLVYNDSARGTGTRKSI